jgi:hypothetical protein
LSSEQKRCSKKQRHAYMEDGKAVHNSSGIEEIVQGFALTLKNASTLSDLPTEPDGSRLQ